jgi:hypothetical protein
MIKHRCPNCDHILNSADGLGGTPIQCWKCHSTLVVPPKSEKGLEVPKEMLVQAEARAKERQSQPGRAGGFWQSFKALFSGKGNSQQPAPPPSV